MLSVLPVNLSRMILCSGRSAEMLTVSVCGADLGDDLQVFLHLPLEALLSEASAVESTDYIPQLINVRNPPPSCQHLWDKQHKQAC